MTRHLVQTWAAARPRSRYVFTKTLSLRGISFISMLHQVRAFLEKNPGTKAKTIATRLGLERTDVNRLLHDHPGHFEKDVEFQWSLASKTRRIEFGGSGWLKASDFERALCGDSPLRCDHSAIVFVLKDDCKPLLEFLGRLLATCNQLVEAGKQVTLDFEGSRQTLKYLDRVDFFGVLAPAITVLPQRPNGHLAKTFQGNNAGVIEFRFIDPKAPDQDIPSLLQDSFVRCAGDSYSQAAFTVLAELFGNVLEHSGTDSTGFACLQFYPRGNCIQAFISDNGRGIVGTLEPAVLSRYPSIAKKMRAAKHPGIALLEEVFSQGQISQVDEDGRGLGLKRSGDVAGKFKATIAVRQSDFELRVHHGPHGISFRSRTDLAHLEGTHICFEFDLDLKHGAG